MQKLVQKSKEDGPFDSPNVYEIIGTKLTSFKEAGLNARRVTYSSMPSSVTHILRLLTTVMHLAMLFDLVGVCRCGTWSPSLMLVFSCCGALKIADAMENPFGFDAEDIPIWEIAEHLDEEICLIMRYAVLDEVGGENLYRSMMGNDMIFLDADSEPDPFLDVSKSANRA